MHENTEHLTTLETPADDVGTTTDVATSTVDDAPSRGVSRRGFLGRAGVAGAAGAVAVTTLSPSVAAAATTAGPAPKSVAKAKAKATATRASAAPALPSAAAVKALNKPLVDHEIFELAALLRSGDTTSVALTQAYLARIDAFNGPFEIYGDNGGYNTFVRIARDEALAQAAAADQRIAAEGAAAPILCGIPLGIKDSVGIAGRPSKNGTHNFDANIAIQDSTAVGRLRDQGVVFLGHCVCSAYSGVIAGTFAGNAWNKDYIPGGSSQGSGAAPINRLAAAAIGEETGGSITWPAAINGSSAIKPSLGLGSMAGVMPLSATYDVLGPLARSGRDAALIMNALIGTDGDNDPQSLAQPQPFPELPMAPREGSKPLKGLTIGIPQTDWMTTTVDNANNTSTSTVRRVSPQSVYDADHKAAFARVRGELEALGATVKEFRGCDITDYGTAPDFLDGDNPYYLNPAVLDTVDGTQVTPRNAVVFANRSEIRYIEAVSDFADTQTPTVKTALANQYGRRPGGSTDVNVAPTFAASALLNNGITAKTRREGERRRRLLIRNYQASLDAAGVDVMLVMSIGAEVGKRQPLNPSAGLPVRRYNQIANDLSWPLVSFPVGVTSNAGLPICVQLWGPRFSEPKLVQAMIDYQAKHPEHHTRFPVDPPAVAAKALPSNLAAKVAEATAAAELPDAPIDPASSNDPVVQEDAAIAERG
ncbi:amidase [Patulibacter minatonensis]|uniref:amidase n=1 Tax=Patulibacter minatonensis TaxID=298163 RepID=UPI000684A77F|nr:amidase [Patulibacter minatonensis]